MLLIPRKVMYEKDEGLLIDHFQRDIKDHDRYLRFGSTRSDESIVDYIENSLLNFGVNNMWFITEDPFDGVIGSVHVNVDKNTGQAEMGFTVSPKYRGRGLGQSLFIRGSTWAALSGANTIYTHCLSENKVMQHIAKKNGMSVVTIDAGEKEATIKVDKYKMQAYYEDKVMDSFAFVDYSINEQTTMVRSLMRL